MNRMVRRPSAAQPLGIGHHRLDFLDAAQHRAEGDELAARDAGDQAASVVLPTPGGPHKNDGAQLVALDLRGAAAFPAPECAPGRRSLPAVPAACARPADASRFRLRAAAWSRTGSRSQCPLPARFVQQNAGRHRGVQRFHAHGGNGDRRAPPTRSSAPTPRASLPMIKPHRSRRNPPPPAGAPPHPAVPEPRRYDFTPFCSQRRARQGRIHGRAETARETASRPKRAASWG